MMWGWWLMINYDDKTIHRLCSVELQCSKVILYEWLTVALLAIHFITALRNYMEQ